MKCALLTLLSVATAGPLLAGTGTNRVESWSITCETVRAYVDQIGLARANAIARANGMTQERKARQCLARAD
jgi:hypothetical protein